MNSHIAPGQIKRTSLDHATNPAVARPLIVTDTVDAKPVPYSFIALFQTIETLRLRDRSFVIQFTAPHRGAGTSTIATGFAIAAAQSYRRPVLLLDAGAAPLASGPIEPVPTCIAGLARGRFANAEFQGAANAPCGVAGLAEQIDGLRCRYHAIIIDCPAIGHSPEAITLARHCDGAALVAASVRTGARDMLAAQHAITLAGGQVLGGVFNRERSYRPRWLGRRG